MSIRPLDYNVMVPKTQEVSSSKQVENLKNRNIVESEFIKQDKVIRQNKQKVMDTKRGTNNKIRDDENNKGNYNPSKKRKKKKENLNEKKTGNPIVGNSIDIRI